MTLNNSSNHQQTLKYQTPPTENHPGLDHLIVCRAEKAPRPPPGGSDPKRARYMGNWQKAQAARCRCDRRGVGLAKRRSLIAPVLFYPRLVLLRACFAPVLFWKGSFLSDLDIVREQNSVKAFKALFDRGHGRPFVISPHWQRPAKRHDKRYDRGSTGFGQA